MLGVQHARAIASAGGVPVLIDVSGESAAERAESIAAEYQVGAWGCRVDITKQSELQSFATQLYDRSGRFDILINNAANNPKVEDRESVNFSRLEHFPL